MGRYYRGFGGHVPACPGKEMTSDSPKYNPYRGARYLVSAHRTGQLPPDLGFEVKMIVV